MQRRESETTYIQCLGYSPLYALQHSLGWIWSAFLFTVIVLSCMSSKFTLLTYS